MRFKGGRKRNEATGVKMDPVFFSEWTVYQRLTASMGSVQGEGKSKYIGIDVASGDVDY